MGEALTIGSLFSGIGGLELGLERAGLGPVLWQVEIDPFCREVLAKHWPNVTRYTDVTTVDTAKLARVDVVCGGFPCQDVSSAGKRRGLDGPRSGLWREFSRIVEAIRPRLVVVENVASGKRLWLPTVKAKLESLGYRTRAYGLSAADVGARHRRRRVFVVADTHGQGESAGAIDAEMGRAPQVAADTHSPELREQSRRSSGPQGTREAEPQHSRWRDPEPDMVRVVHGIPRGLDRHRRRALGNSVVPQCAEVIGRLIREIQNP